jgi:hypothetical protein
MMRVRGNAENQPDVLAQKSWCELGVEVGSRGSADWMSALAQAGLMIAV